LYKIGLPENFISAAFFLFYFFSYYFDKSKNNSNFAPNFPMGRCAARAMGN